MAEATDPITTASNPRECWINVSVVGFRAGREAVLGSMWGTRAQAVAVGEYSQYRLHVRLKPEVRS